MFARALKKVEAFTNPVIVLKRLITGEVQAGCATFVVLNPEGWIITASHVISDFRLYRQHQVEIAEYNKKINDIKSDVRHTEKQRRNKMRSVQTDPKWITNISYWWTSNEAKINAFEANDFLDIAIGRIEPFDSGSIANYPIFKNPAHGLDPGTSLCRLGFPFHAVEASFDERTNRFVLKEGTLPLPRFPIEGMHTRVAVKVDKETGAKAQFIETSSPGLRGQSGGPIFDVEGNIWAIQSSTFHLPLGFSPKIRKDNKEVEEHQFLNTGVGTHVEEIIAFLKKYGVAFSLAS